MIINGPYDLDSYRENRLHNTTLIKTVCMNHMEDPDVQEGYPDANGNVYFPGTKIKVTWCHRYANRCLNDLGVDVSDLYYKNSIDWTTVQYMYNKATDLSKDGASWVKEIDVKFVNNWAYWGVPLLVLAPEGYGHAAIVAPANYQNDSKIMIYNQGTNSVKGLKILEDVFQKNKLNPKFFLLQKRIKDN